MITAARILRDDRVLEQHEIETVESTFEWFNDNIPCPPFQASLASGKWTPHAVAWFRPEAGEAIQRMWQLVAILKEHGVPVRVVRSASPGMIVYRDEFQVVVETPKRA